MHRCLFILSLLLSLGCATEPVFPLRSHVLKTTSADQLPGAMALPPETTIARWNAKASRLTDDVPRAIKRSNWGLIEWLPAPQVQAGQKQGPMRAEALLPDNRTAIVHAWVLGDHEVAAAVLIGNFGDPAMQREFLQMLADALADKPKPKRGGLFFLPQF